jgi:type I restriction enzyme S subunit
MPFTENDREKYELRLGDLLVCEGGEVGRTAVWEGPSGIYYQKAVHRLRAKKPLEPRYVMHYMRWAAERNVFARLTSSTSIAHLTKTKLKRLQIPLPPLSAQKRLAAILDAADALRTKRRESLEQLDELVQSVFLDMFGDPVTNPKGFPISKLRRLYADDSNGTKCGPFGSALKKDELVKAGIPVWNMDNISPPGRMSLPFRMWITPEKFESLRAYEVQAGDVIVSRAGTVGKMCVADIGDRPSIISTNLIRVRFGPAISPRYFVDLMTFFGPRVGRLRTGPDGAFTHMNTKGLDGLEIPVPPAALQQRHREGLERIEAQRLRISAHLAELDTLFASLQSRAFRGDL